MAEKLEESYANGHAFRKRTSQLRESEEKYRESINLANDAIFTLEGCFRTDRRCEQGPRLTGRRSLNWLKEDMEIVSEYDQENTTDCGTGLIKKVLVC